MQNLKKACQNNVKANALTKSFDISKTNFKECMKKLDARFLVVRNVIYQIVNNLIDTQKAGNDGNSLMKLYDVVSPTLINMESLIRQTVLTREENKNLSDEQYNLKIKEKMLNGIIAAFINRKLDNATSTHIASS